MSWGFFTHNIARPPFVCNALDLAMRDYDYYWPMDDGDRGAVVPTAFHKESGPVYDMSSSVGEGGAWNSGPWDNLSSADLALSPFTFCNTRSVLQHSFGGFDHTLLDNVGASTDIRGFHHTAILLGGRDNTYTIDVDQDWFYDFGGGNTQIRPRNPRLGVSVDHSTATVTFSASFLGGNPSVSISFDNTQPVNVVTVFFPAPVFDNGFTYVFNCYINDEPMDTVTIAEGAVTATVAFDSHGRMQPFRSGVATWLGFGMDFNSTSKHSDIWNAVQSNTDN